MSGSSAFAIIAIISAAGYFVLSSMTPSVSGNGHSHSEEKSNGMHYHKKTEHQSAGKRKGRTIKNKRRANK